MGNQNELEQSAIINKKSSKEGRNKLNYVVWDM